MTKKVRPSLLAGAMIASFAVQAIAQTTAPDIDQLTKDVDAKIAVLKARVIEKPRAAQRKATAEEDLKRMMNRQPDEPKLSPAEEKMRRLKGALEDIRNGMARGNVAEATRGAEHYAKATDDDPFYANAGPPAEWAALAKSLAALTDAKLNVLLQQSKDLIAAMPQKMKEAKGPDDLGTIDDALVDQLRSFGLFSEIPR
ncbi:MAG: hypothetical protein JWM57_1020, partial [Phycisphaerales bacterium]|nr:hypothetical protein [Phycisphaerales bacterium]